MKTNFDYSSYNKSNYYDETYFYLNDYIGESIFIKHLLKNRKNIAFLELGCGTGSLIRQLSTFTKLRGVDISYNLLNIARKKRIKNAKFFHRNIIDFKTKEKFDLIYISTYLIQTFANEREIILFLKKLKSFLKQKGLILFSWIDEESYNHLYKEGKFFTHLENRWKMEGETRKLKSNKRRFNLKFINGKSQIKSSALYLPLTKKTILSWSKKINSEIDIFNGNKNGLPQEYQKWGVIKGD